MADAQVSIPAYEADIEALGFRVADASTRITRQNDRSDVLSAQVSDLLARVEALENPPPTTPLLEFAWWAMSNEANVAAYAEAGFTHNVLWTVDCTVAYLDLLHGHGLKAYVVMEPEFVGHPAVVGAVVADEPDLMVSGVPKRTIETVASTAAQAREMWPGILVASTMGSPLAAGPWSTAEAESTDAGYWSLSTGPYANSVDDVARFSDGYGAHIDVCWPQMYTVAGNPVQPRYRRQEPLSTIDAAPAGVRESSFVTKGMVRASRLLPSTVEVGALLAPCKFHGDFGRDPTYDELMTEGRAVAAAGGRRILYFTKGGGGGMSGDVLTGTQLATVTQAIADLQAN